MGTKIRSEISKKKMYWLPKHRQLELVHFCLQYPDWKMRLATLDGYSGWSSSIVQMPEKNGTIGKPVERTVEERMMLEMKIRMVESAAYEAANDLHEYLLKGVTQEIGYEMLGIPCCTATSQETTHFLKLATTKYKLEVENLELQKELTTAKTESIRNGPRIDELYQAAINAVRKYGGHPRDV